MFGNFVLLVLWVLTSAQFCTLDIQGTPDLTGGSISYSGYYGPYRGSISGTPVLTGAQFRVLGSLQELNFVLRVLQVLRSLLGLNFEDYLKFHGQHREFKLKLLLCNE